MIFIDGTNIILSLKLQPIICTEITTGQSKSITVVKDGVIEQYHQQQKLKNDVTRRPPPPITNFTNVISVLVTLVSPVTFWFKNNVGGYEWASVLS